MSKTVYVSSLTFPSGLHLPSYVSRCPNLAVKEAEDDENIEEDDAPIEKTKKVSHAKRKKQTECNLTWIGEPVLVKSS